MKKFITFILCLMPAFAMADYSCHFTNFGKLQIEQDKKGHYIKTQVGKNYDIKYTDYVGSSLVVINYENGPSIITIESNEKAYLTENYIDSKTGKIHSGRYVGKCLKYK